MKELSLNELQNVAGAGEFSFAWGLISIKW